MDNYKIAVVAIIEHNNQVLIGKKIKTNHFLSNVWHIPGGKLKKGENENQALIREIKEEAGIDIKINKFLDERIISDTNIRARWYLCSPITHNPKVGSDLADVKYIPKSDVLKICHSKAVSLWPSKVIKYFRR